MDKFYSRKIIINKEQNNFRLDQSLAKLSNLTRSQIKNLLLKGNVQINGEIFKDISYKVKQGEEYLLNLIIPGEKKFEPENIPLDIIFEDSDIIIINKLAGMVTHPAPGHNNGTLVNALLSHTSNTLSNINDSNRPGIVHRLDKETSGLIVVAKNNESHLSLAAQFKDHSISRKYKAIVWGVPIKQTIDGYIERHRINRKKMSLNNNGSGRYSKTHIKLIKSYEIASLVECKLETGRTHQVRLHMTSINSPLIGDKVYGKNKINQFSKNKNTFNKFLILKNFDRQALHAFHLGFRHPKTNNYIEYSNDIPKDMKNLLDLIVKY
jgi:23S rRNA pseudouridine1911/1915/1917 synthase